MHAQIKIVSFETSIWRGVQESEHQVSVHLVEQGARISSAGLGVSQSFEITAVRPTAVDLIASPPLVLQSSERGPFVGPLTLEVGETARLQTPSFDAWGHWLLTLETVIA